MKIQNHKMAGQALALRFAGTVVSADADGVFEVPEKDGEFMLQFPGWAAVKEAPKAAKAPEKVEEPKVEEPKFDEFSDESVAEAPRSDSKKKRSKS